MEHSGDADAVSIVVVFLDASKKSYIYHFVKIRGGEDDFAVLRIILQ